jgi:hypothetical protein
MMILIVGDIKYLVGLKNIRVTNLGAIVRSSVKEALKKS